MCLCHLKSSKTRSGAKWHNTPSYYTNECRVFQQQIQSTIEQGRFKFDN
jgi:hypothetical protein